MTVLCGGNARQAQYYADKHHFDRSKYRIATKPEDLYGYIHGTLLIMVGKWREDESARKTLERGRDIGMATVEEL